MLGEGAFGATHSMRSRVDGQLYAVKMIKVKKAGLSIDELKKEAARLALLSHPHIVRYFTACEFKKQKLFAIVTEMLTGGSFTQRVTALPEPTEAQMRRWVCEIASGLECIHASRMLHR